MDSLVDRERAPDQEKAGPAVVVPDRGAQAGGRRARAALSVALVALVLLASLAAWQGFLHSSWGKRLGALNQIVFVGGSFSASSEMPTTPQLYVIQPDGSGLRRLTSEDENTYISPVWSPDGSRIAAFVAMDHRNPIAHLAIMDADGSNARVISAVALPPDAFNGDSGLISEASRLIAWSPDNRQLVALVGGRQYVLVQADGSRPRTLDAIRPTWSPDGRYLAFYAAAPGDEEGSSVSYLIQLLDTETFTTRTLSHLADLNADALAWSPDGRYLAASAFSGGSFRGQPIDSIVLIDPTTGKVNQTVQWSDALVHEIAWSPDSQRLAVVVQGFNGDNFSQDDSGGFELVVASLDGSHTLQIGLTDGSLPSWSPDGKRLVYDSPTDPVLLVADTTQPHVVVRTLAVPALEFLFAPCWSPLASVL